MLGDCDTALSQFQEALQIKEKTVGTQSEYYTITLENIAKCHAIYGLLDHALDLFIKSANIRTSIIEQVFHFSSEQQKVKYFQMIYFKLELFLSSCNQIFF